MTHETVTKMIRQGKSPLGLAFLFMTQIGLSYSQRVFYWENDYLAETSEENPEYRSIPVIEGEKVVVTCWVRATSNSEYRMTMYHDYHDASSSGMIEQHKDGVKYVKEVVNVNVVNSAAIDEQDIFCEINKPTEETISLLFKSFVIDNISDPDQVCEACEAEGKVTMTLRRPSKQRKEDDKFEKALKLKLKEQYGATEEEVKIDNEGIVTAKVNLNLLLNRDGVNKTKKVEDFRSQCTGCHTTTTTTTTSTPSPASEGQHGSVVGGTLGGLFSFAAVLGLAAYCWHKKGRLSGDNPLGEAVVDRNNKNQESEMQKLKEDSV